MPENGPSDPAPAHYDSQTLLQLLEQLHKANEHFSTARRHVETLLNWQDYDHPDHDRTENELRAANAELQAVTARINEMLRR
jgi:hypothetical protein